MSDDYETENYEDISTNEVGEGTIREDRDSFISKLTSTDKRYLNLWYQLRGYAPDGRGNWKKGRELSGEEFANKAVASFSAVVNDTNSITRKSSNEVTRILHDSVETFIRDAHNDETVEDNDLPVLSKIFEHNLELFLGLVEGGHGSKVISALMTGQKLEMNDSNKKEESFMDYLRGRV